MKNLLAVILTLMCIHFSYSQNILNIEERNKTVYSKFGIEPTYVLAVGYMHSFSLEKINRKFVLFGEMSSPTKLFGVKNYEAKLGGMINLIEHKGFGINYHLNFSTGHVETKNFDSQKMAFANKLFLGYFKRKWYITITGEYEKIYANKIVHSEYYRDFIFPEAKDGWYNGAGGNFQFGIETGITIKEYLDIQLEIKMPVSEKFDSYNGSPAHLNLLLGYRF